MFRKITTYQHAIHPSSGNNRVQATYYYVKFYAVTETQQHYSKNITLISDIIIILRLQNNSITFCIVLERLQHY